MSNDFNVNHISYRFFGDKLTSLDLSNNLIIESSDNNIELKTTNKTIGFNNNTIFNYGLTLKNNDLSNIINITGKILNIDTLFVTDIANSQANIDDYGYINNGYIRATTIGYNPAITNSIIESSNAYFTYIDVSGGDSSFNNSVYIKNSLDVSGATTISNDLIVNGTSYVTLYNAISSYIINIKEELSTNKILTLDLSATNISVSNELVVSNTSFLNDLSISGHLVDSVLKVPHDFTIDPSGHDNASGTLIINGDLIVYGNKTTINSNIVEISDITLSVATNLINTNDLYNNQAGLDISNVASIKYDGANWNISGGQLTVENKKVGLDVSLIALKTSTETSLNSLNSYFDLSYRQLKNNLDNSYNATYNRSQIDASFLLKSDFDISYNSFRTYVDNSYVSAQIYDASFRDLKTYLDASYILKGTISDPNAIDLSLNFLRNKLDLSFVLKSVFDASYNNLKSQIDASFASVRLTSLDTPSISVDTINSKHSSGQTFNNTLWNQLGLDISSGGPFNNNYNKIAVSNDGKVFAYSKLYSVLDPSQVEQAVTNWTLRTIPTNFSSGYNAAIAWSPQLQIFVVVGQGTSNTKTMYSYNGSDWFLGSMLTSLGGIGCKTVCWSPQRNLFVALAGEGSQFNDYKVMTSSNGINWTERATPSSVRGLWFNHVCWSPELSIFVAVSVNNGGIITSLDGITWTVSSLSNIVVGRYTSICWSAQLGIFVVIEYAGTGVIISNDGKIWNRHIHVNTALQGNYWQHVCWSTQLGLFVAVGSSGTYRIMTSNNGTDWTPVYNIADINMGLFFVDWIKELNLFIALGTFGGPQVITSPNGVNWTSRTIPSDGGWLGCSWSSEQRILVAIASTVTGYSGPSRIMTSSVTTPFALEPKGRVYVYELSYNRTSYNWNQLGLSSEIIVGLSNDDQFGWDIALSSNGRVVAGSSIASDASGINCGQVRLFELSNNVWIKKGSAINGPRAGSESGYSISLAGNGNSIAIGAWRDNSNGTNICGAVRVYDFSATINDWRQKGPTIFGISGSNEGYSTALSLDGQTLACGNPSHNTSTSTITTITNTATGGTITTSGSYRIHSFTTVGSYTFTPSFSGPVEVLIVGGGGGGGPNLGGGGGGGAVIWIPATNVSANTNYSIVVGDGGNSGTNGQNSSAFGALADGGGTSGSYDNGIGTSGGSGGGAAANGIGINQGGGVSNVSTLGTNSGFIYGNNGGNMLVSRTSGPTRAAGGGGAGPNGTGKALDTDSNTTGDTGRTGMGSGGVGYSSAILGQTYLWGGGGGGAAWADQVGGYGGLGGGGGGSGLNGGGLGGGSALVAGSDGSLGGNTAGGAGGTNTGGGGGGGNHSSGLGGKGGSGIVVIRYLQQVTINTTIVNLNVGLVKIFSWSGTTWEPKGTIQGPDISNSYFGRSIKLSANGNTIVASMPVIKTINFSNSSATTGWSYSAWTNDTSIGLDPNLNYTVAANLGGSMALATTINGVPFQAGVPFQTSAYRGTNFLIEGSDMGVADSTNNNISGASRDLANDFIYGSNVYTVTLYNLIPGKKYQTTFFSLAWDGGGSTERNQTFSTSTGVSILINPNIYGLNNGIVIKNTFIANNTGTQVFTITRINNNITFHFYALTNVLLDIKISEELRGGTFVYSYQGGTTWTQLGQAIQGISGTNEFGSSVNISNDGTIISVGTNDISSNRGYVNVYKYVDNYWRQISNTLNGKVLSFKAGLNALSGDGTTLFQSNNNYYTVYGINKLLALNSPITSISGNLIVIGATSINSLDISRNHSFSTNGYSYKVFESALTNAIMKEYYSDVSSVRDLKVRILGNGDITNRNNSYSSLSDSRLKENIVTSGPKLEDLLKVRVVNYTMKGSNNTKYIGVLAQELEGVFPNMVIELEPSPKDIQDGNTIKYKTVNYSSFDPILIKSLQEQNAMLKNIEKRIIALEEEFEDN